MRTVDTDCPHSAVFGPERNAERNITGNIFGNPLIFRGYLRYSKNVGLYAYIQCRKSKEEGWGNEIYQDERSRQ